MISDIRLAIQNVILRLEDLMEEHEDDVSEEWTLVKDRVLDVKLDLQDVECEL